MKSLVLTLGLVMTAGAWAAGELPFPFQGDGAQPPLMDLKWSVENTDLSLQIKIYETDHQTRTAKIWIRQSDGFVWQRAWIESTSASSDVAVSVDEVSGVVHFRWDAPERTELELGGRQLRLER